MAATVCLWALLGALTVVAWAGPVQAAVMPGMVTTVAAGTVPVGSTLTATAVLSGGDNPTGTILFSLYGPNNPMCTGNPVTTMQATVAGNGSYSSTPYQPLAAGTYNFVSTYQGDATNTAVTDPCGTAGQSVMVALASPGLSVSLPPSATVGASVTATATLAGGLNPTGTIDFHLYGPSSPSCAGPPLAMSTVTVTAGDGTYSSAPFAVSATGTYQILAIYSGDAGNAGSTQQCGGPNQSMQVVQGLSLTDAASGSVALGGAVTDTATISGGANPTGALTFTLFGPDDATCARPASAPLSVGIGGDGSYASGPVTPTAAGTYQWVVSYPGDAANAPATTACGASGSTVTVTSPQQPHLDLSVSGGGPVGTEIAASAVLSGGTMPSGSILFSLFGPDDGSCAGPAVTSTAAVGTGPVASGPFRPSAAGDYRFVAAYSGDAHNLAASTTCGQAGSAVTLGKATPTLSAAASAPADVGASLSDGATLAGGANPTGTLVFLLFGPQDPSCSQAPVATLAQKLSGNGSYASGPVTAQAAGPSHWIAAYGGDGNNAPVATACGASGQTAVVFPGGGGPSGPGYWLLASDGGIFSYGGARFLGSAASLKLNKPIVAMAPTADYLGYWVAASDGGVFIYGDASYYGSAAAVKLNRPIVGLAGTPDRRGYWLVASDGGIFAYGDAAFYGSPASLHLNSPIIGMAAAPDGKGYWLVASDGGIFAYGDAAFYGSPASVKGAKATVGMAPAPDGNGYWVVGTDGGVFAYGDAAFYGSTGSLRLNSPVVGLAPSPTGHGYWLGAADGGIFAYGDTRFYGSAGGMQLNARVIGVAAG